MPGSVQVRLTQISKKQAVSFYLTIAPWLVGFLVFTAGPMLLSLLASFTDWDLLTDPVWVGLDNYRRSGERSALSASRSR